MLLRSPESAELVKEGKTKKVGATYHLDTGGIEWLGEHPLQKEIIEKEEATRQEIPASSTAAVSGVSSEKPRTESAIYSSSKAFGSLAWLPSIGLVIVLIAAYFLRFNGRTRIQRIKVGLRLKLAFSLTAVACIGCAIIIQKGVSAATVVQLSMVITIMLVLEFCPLRR